MAGNIDQRRAYIKQQLQSGKVINIKEVIKMFDSSYPAVMNDISVVSTGEAHCKKNLTTGQNTRSRRFGDIGRLGDDEWQMVLKSHNNACAICGAVENISIDHIVPLSKGGTNTIDNVQPLCRSCNSRKGNRV